MSAASSLGVRMFRQLSPQCDEATTNLVEGASAVETSERLVRLGEKLEIARESLKCVAMCLRTRVEEKTRRVP